MVPLCSLLQLNGKRYDLADFFSMTPMFRTAMSDKTVWKCGRQVSKTTASAASISLRTVHTPYLRTLVISPRGDQVFRLSNRYFKPFLESSPYLRSFVDKNCDKAVSYKTFRNFASIAFEFAYMSVDRIRNITTDIMYIDEIQDMDYDFLPVLSECQSMSRLYKVTVYTGTPKTLDNTIQALWENSSQAEWITKCAGCGHHNTPALHLDLMKMIGKDTIICANCKSAIDPREGGWRHEHEDRTLGFTGYHVPQIIMPDHYAIPKKWKALLAKKAGMDNYTMARFLNEVMGESSDAGTRLITVTDLRKVSILPPMSKEETMKRLRGYTLKVLGVDWGGGGEDNTSFTTAVLAGLRPDGVIEVPWMERLPILMEDHEQAVHLLRLWKEFRAHFFAHDYGGAGSVRASIMLQAGLPADRVISFCYLIQPTKSLIVLHEPDEHTPRSYYALDKSRSLMLQASAVKLERVLFPEYESAKELTKDFLALYEERVEGRGSDVLHIRRSPKLADDVAHSVNFACCAIWERNKNFPDIARLASAKLTREEKMLMDRPPPIRVKKGYDDETEE